MDKLRAFLKANRGKAVELSRKLTLSPSTISQWQNVPPEHLRDVSDFTGIPISELRPDLAALFSEPAQ